MIRALIYGVTGYTGIELIRILSSHPDVSVVGGTSRQSAGKRLSEVFPFCRNALDFTISAAEEISRHPQADAAFLALPHGESAALVRPLLDSGVKVVDLSADFRLRDADVYSKWYGAHPDPGLVEAAVYGLPEIHRAEIANASLVANPGCYPTSVLLATAPLFARAELDTSTLIVDSKSGVSGAGRGAKLNTSFCEAGEGFKPYGVLGHRHTPEMEQELTLLAGRPVKVRFTPHLIPVSRGMVSAVYVRMKSAVSGQALRDDYHRRYEAEPFVRVLPAGSFPDTAHVRGSNACHVSVEVDERSGWVIAMSAIDNLVKGASGEAVQNLNIMMGLEETAGLGNLPLFP
jgi:N-acetyl-gamma-glutamyl-phosphate reductase